MIQTVPKRGYRFVAKVEKLEENPAEKAALIVESKRLATLPIVSGNKKSRRVLTVTALFSLLFLTSFAYYSWHNTDAPDVPAAKRNIKTLAVLPFKNLGGETADDAISLGLTDSLISHFGSLKQFTLRPFSAVEKYAESGTDALEFGRKIKCDAVLVRTVQNIENRLRVNVRLLDVRDGTQIWTAAFDRDESDVFALQDTLAKQVAGSLIEKLTDADEKILGKEYTETPEAYRAYLRGRMLFERPRKDGFQPTLEEYQKAVSLDSAFALAYCALADLFVRQGNTMSGGESREAYKKARIYAQKAIELDGDLSQAHTSMGRIARVADWDWNEAEKYLKRAIEINDSDFHAHILYGHLHIFRGDYDAALQMLDRAVEIDPVTPASPTLLMHVFEGRGDFQEGLRRTKEFYEFDKESAIARVAYARFLYLNGDYEKLISAVEESLVKRQNFDYQWFSLLAAAHRRLGQMEKSAEYLHKLEESAGQSTKYLYALAITYSELGRFDEAIRLLEKCFQQHE